MECEDILGVAYRAYEALTGQEFTVEVPGRHPWPGFPDLGEDWDFDDAAEMRARYPRLWALCGWDGGILGAAVTSTTVGASVCQAAWGWRWLRACSSLSMTRQT